MTALALAFVSPALAVASGSAPSPQVVATVTVGTQPWGVAITPDGSRAYVGNSGSTFVSVIDMRTFTVIESITTGSSTNPAGVAISPDGSKIFVTNYGSFSVSVISGSTATSHPIGCINPLSVAMRFDGAGIYVACGDGRLRYMANAAGYANSTVAANTGTASGVAILPRDVDLLYTMVGSSPTLHRTAEASLVSLPGQPNAVATDSIGTRAYVVDASGSLSSVRLAAWPGIEYSSSIGGELTSIAISADDRYAYVTDKANDEVKVFDLLTRSVVATVPVGGGPQRIVLSPDGRKALVTNNLTNTVSVIDIPARQVFGDDVPSAPLQQFATSANSQCLSQPEDLIDFPALARLRDNYWGLSWAQWPNGGTGGFVCTRQPYYTSANTWSAE